MTAFFVRLRLFVAAFRADTRGVIFPYVALMLVVFIGVGALALDGGRYMSLQTQMQGVADSLALAGARELNTQAGARARATSAINNLVSNGLTGLGYSGAITNATPVFYSALPVATAGFAGTLATSDLDAKFVAVTVNPATIPTIMPITFFQAGASNNVSTGARAIAGFKNRAVCGITPVFICNPYETSGMTDSQATAALYAALDPNDPAYVPSTKRRLFRMLVVGNNSSPGHFGWLQAQNTSGGNIAGCNPNSTPCLNQLVAYDDSTLSRQCFDGNGVTLATGNKPVPDAFNVRFDIYNKAGLGPTANFTPSINVRKGFIQAKNNSWCVSNGQNTAGPGDYLGVQSLPANANITVPLAPAQAQLTVTAKNSDSTIAIGSIVGTIQNGMSISTGSGVTASIVGTVNGTPSGTTIPVSLTNAITAPVQLTFSWLTAPLPFDQNWTGVCSGGTCLQGDGNWDCLNYWNINHPAAHTPPSGCTASNPTVSRFDVYNAENLQAAYNPAAQPPAAANDINDWSGIPPGTPNAQSTETGAPMCAINSGFTPTYNSTYDPRVINVAVINCSAQTALGNITGGNSGNAVPVAGFAKYFLTQPYGGDGSQNLYGEMTGLVAGLDSVRILNQVQLYR